MKSNYEYERDENPRIYILIAENNYCNAHYHKNLELVYVLEGRHKVIINGKEKILEANEIGFSNSLEMHYYHYNEYSKIFTLVIPDTFLKNYYLQVKSGSLPNFLLNKEKNLEIKNILSNMDKKFYKKNELIVDGTINLILGILLENYPIVEDKEEKYNELTIEIIKYIEKNYQKDLSLDNMAERFGYSKVYLSNIFIKHTNSTLIEYINKTRIIKSLDLIEKTTKSYENIALEVGFSSIRTFYRIFSKIMNTSPYSYRKMGINNRS